MTQKLSPTGGRPSPWQRTAVTCLDCAHARTRRGSDPLAWTCAAGEPNHGPVYTAGYSCCEDETAAREGFDASLLRPRHCPHFTSAA